MDYWHIFYNHSFVRQCSIQPDVLLNNKQCGLIPPLSQLFSGHCCIQTVVLSIIDKDGFFDQCSFTLSTQPLTIVQYPTTTEELTTLQEITSSRVRATLDIYLTNIFYFLFLYIKVHVSSLTKQATLLLKAIKKNIISSWKWQYI